MTNRKQKGGMGLPSFLLPIGFIVARAAAPKIVRSLKKTFSKQMGGRKQRKIRTYRKKNKRKTRRSRRQRGGVIERDIDALYIENLYIKAGATNDMFQNDINHMKKHYPGQLSVLLKFAKKSVSDALENTTIALEGKSPKSPKGKRRTKGRRTKGRRTKRRTKGKRRKRTKGKRSKNKQNGGFMRGSTRNFCTLNLNK